MTRSSTLLSTLLIFASHALAFTPPTGNWSTYAANSAISRDQGNGLDDGVPLVNYPDGVFQWALRLLYERDGNASYFDYIVEGVDNVVSANGSVGGGYNLTDYTLDPIRVGPSFVYLYNMTGEEKYKTAADLYRSQLNGHPRTAEGQFWHKLRYPNQGWLDGIYMGEVFYAAYTALFEPTNQTAWDDISLQFSLMHTNTRQYNATVNQTQTGLLYHGYDYSHVQDWASPDRGHSPEVWDRALGWYFMALVDVLQIAPVEQTELRETLEGILKDLAPNLVKQADPETGVWWLVITWPGREGNYLESSAGSMFIYSLLRAVRLGYLDDPNGTYVAAAKKAFEYATTSGKWVITSANGTMSYNETVVVGSLAPGNDYDYYISQPVDLNDLKGLAPFVLAAYEIEALN
ncbi:glycoside hydrolase family 105 protein [Peniophora sp. CONT]|nr:glycoside hydrolase family 105 protein [Peniophora sp. CONT]